LIEKKKVELNNIFNFVNFYGLSFSIIYMELLNCGNNINRGHLPIFSHWFFKLTQLNLKNGNLAKKCSNLTVMKILNCIEYQFGIEEAQWVDYQEMDC
jgi:hypothetical protein